MSGAEGMVWLVLLVVGVAAYWLWTRDGQGRDAATRHPDGENRQSDEAWLRQSAARRTTRVTGWQDNTAGTQSAPRPGTPTLDPTDAAGRTAGAKAVQPDCDTPPVRKTIKGKAWVIDGDTIDVAKVRLRLFGIDAPEMDHPYGIRAKRAMMALCKGQIVTAEVVDEDAHGRTVARCHLPDGRDLSAELVSQGLALDWPKFSGGCYSALETSDARRKLWLAAARQKGQMHVWEKFAAQQAAKR